MMEKPKEKFNQSRGWDESKDFWPQEYWVQCTGWIDTLCSICQIHQNNSYQWLYFHAIVQKEACCWIVVMKIDSLTADGFSWQETKFRSSHVFEGGSGLFICLLPCYRIALQSINKHARPGGTSIRHKYSVLAQSLLWNWTVDEDKVVWKERSRHAISF